jgi:hypothetical protein
MLILTVIHTFILVNFSPIFLEVPPSLYLFSGCDFNDLFHEMRVVGNRFLNSTLLVQGSTFNVHHLTTRHILPQIDWMPNGKYVVIEA